MQYQAIVRWEGNARLAEFPDCPGCQTFVDGNEDLTAAATEALEGWLEAELQAGRVPPMPGALVRSPRGTRPLAVRINPQLSAKVQLRHARQARGWTQAQLAEELGVTQQAVAKLEHPDRSIEIATLARLAEVLGFDLSVLMTSRKTAPMVRERTAAAYRPRNETRGSSSRTRLRKKKH